MNPWRVIAGLLLAPLIGLFGFALVATIVRPQGETMSMFGLAVYFTYLIEIVFGVPVLIAFALLRWRRSWQYAIGGALIGPLALGAIRTPPHISQSGVGVSRSFPEYFSDILQNMAYEWDVTRNQALLGASVALIFWLIALYEPRKRVAI